MRFRPHWSPLHPFVRAFLGVVLAFQIPFFLPWVTGDQLATYSVLYPLVSMPLAVWLLRVRTGSASGPAQRRFWNLLSLAFAFWSLVEVVVALVHLGWMSEASASWPDTLFVFYFLAWFAAAGIEPHRDTTDSTDSMQPVDVLRWIGTTLAAAGLIVYVAVPRSDLPATHSMGAFSMLFTYAALETILAVRLLWLARRAAAVGASSASLVFLALAQVAWTGLDLLQAVPSADGRWWNDVRAEPLWNVPFILLALAVQVRFQAPAGVPKPPERSAPAVMTGWSPLVLLALTTPFAHIALHELGLLDDGYRSGRAVVVIVLLIALTLLATIENRVLHRLALRTAAAQRALADMRVAKEVAERANEVKSLFLANISHELRTPMTGLLGFSDLLLDANLGAEWRHRVELLRASGRQLLRIIDDLLDITRIEHGQLVVVTESVALRELVADTIAVLRPAATAKALALEIGVAAEIPAWIESDPARLRQVVTNLVSNAINFTDTGSVSLRVSRADLGPAARAASPVVRFDVEDTGIGVGPADEGRLFRPFTQLEKLPSRRRGGTGLGLAICHGVVTGLGGAIGYQSRAGGGSRFWFQIPLVEASPVAAAARPAAGAGGAIGVRILVAEDEPAIRLITKLFLDSLGCETVVVAGGAEAVELASRQRFDAILMDCEMADTDGYEATRQLRGRGVATPVIALTAHAFASDRAACLAAGMDDYLAKPFDRAGLAAVLARWLPPAAVTPNAGHAKAGGPESAV